MAQGKKISELTEVSSVTDNDEFLFVDKEGSGANSGVGGQTAKIKFSDLKSAIGAGTTGAKGALGDKGMKGESGPRGLDGSGTQYWTQSPSNGDAVYYDAGNVGIGTDSPRGAFHVQPTSDRPFTVSSTGMVGIGVSQGGANMGSDLSQYHLELASHSLGGPTLGLHNYQDSLTEIGKINFVVGQGDGLVTAQIIGSRDFGDGVGSSLRFLTKGTNADPVQERMIISANGNVGIGTATPTGQLDVVGTIQSNVPEDTNAFSKLTYGGGNTKVDGTGNNRTTQPALIMQRIGEDGSSERTVSIHSDKESYFMGGNVGIGTATPTYAKLVVRGGGSYSEETRQPMDTQLEVYTSNTASAIQSIQRDNNNAASDIHFWGNDFIFRSANGTGRVGIGTDSPTSMLDIQTDNTDAVPIKVQSMHPNQTGLRLTNGAGDTASAWTMMSRSYGDTLSPSSLAFMHGTDAPSEENQTLVLSSNGTVGIGTHDPISTLQVETENSTLYNGAIMPTIQNVTGCFRNSYSNGIKAGTHTGLQLNVYGNKDSSMDLTDLSNQNVLGYVGVVAEEDNSNKGALIFHSSPNGTNRYEGMRLASNNNLGIGTSTPKAIVSIRGNNSGDKARVSFLGDGNGLIGSVRGEVVSKITPDPVGNPGGSVNSKGDLTFHTNSYSQVAGATYSDDVEKEAFRLTTDGGMVHTASGFYRSRAARFYNTTNDNTKKDREIKFYVGADMNYRIKITIDGLAPYNYNGTAFFKEYEIVGQTETTEGMHYGHLIEQRELQASNIHVDAKPDFYELNYNRVQDENAPGGWVFWISVKVRFAESYVANARVEGYMDKALSPNQQSRTIINGSSQVDTLDGFGIVPIVEDGVENVQLPEDQQYPTTKSESK